MKVGCELSAFMQVPVQIILFTLQSDRLQIIIYEMENYIQQAKSEERNIFQRYINKCKLFYGTTMCLITMTAIIMWFGPLVLNQPFPIEVEYPFDVNKQPLRTIIYLHHIIVVYQSRVQVCSNIFVALLLWFIAARFDILSQKFQKITSTSEFIICIQLHQRLLRYAKDVTTTVRYIALSTIGFSTIAVVFSGLTFLSSNDIGHAGYESLWYSKDVSLQKNLLYTVSRCQHPVTLTVPCMLPTLSLNYYASLVTFEMENFCELLKPREEAIFQRYIDKCVYFYGGSMFWIYLSAIFIISGPITLDQPFPTNAEYPFNIYHQPLRSIIFIQQIIACVQGAAQLCMNIFMALLIWFTSARLEILIEKLQRITNISDLKKCIQEHQNLLKYAEEVTILIRPIALSTVSFSTIALIIVGLILLTDQPLSMKIQCVGIMFSGLSVVFMYTWPAEHLIQISDEIGQAVFDTEWYQQPVDLRKDILIVMLRAQKPIIISVPCIMPALSLKYYASYLSTIFSYFTTLRVTMQNV
ncbi:PREDICTED: putative odorant receptor 69a [Cyphomyrmex costatus]|uniref:putative odorant receptor 69a n=1 Tax=Cyphomyrmex costatus TaxID=456900 RepID=UPI000852369E|nr:PREDICTED: putative odorant receptor 69a [Cyphomyrmex costatus]